MKRKIITLLIGTLAVFAFMPVSSALAINLTSANCGTVLNVTNGNYDLTANMNCTTRHGLIIGAAGITIDGHGYKLDGGGAAGRTCTVKVDDDGYPENPPWRIASNGHGLSSGIYNAIDTGPVGGCPVSGAGIGEGGCNGLTVKNLEITGWCDGIFVSGTIDNPDDPATHTLVEGLKIDHNVIHHNGEDCDTCFNDAVFTAMLGVADSSYPNPTPINNPGEYTCTAGNTSVISNNNIWSQKGWGIEAGGAGGNGINLQGGMNYAVYLTNPVRYSSCVEVHNNAIMKTRVSGIMLSHALEGVNIYKNDIEYTEYGGITIPYCSPVKFNTIEHNVISKCAGVGIGVCGGTHITGNVVKDTVDGLAHFDQAFYTNEGDGILVVSGGYVGNTSDLQDNISCFSYDKDIKVVNDSDINCGDNQCCKTNDAANSCHRWNCACFDADENCNASGTGGAGWSDWKNCMAADINNDGAVTGSDMSIISGSWNDFCTDTW